MRFRKPKKSELHNYAFIDNQNLNLGIQKVGWKMNWRKFREFLQERYDVEKAYMFIGYMPEYEELYAQMHDSGYLVVLKPTVGMFNTEEEKKLHEKKGDDKKPTTKGNIDADLVLHAMKELPNFNKAIIVSGDGDFFALAEYLAEQNKLLHIMAPNWQYSSLLKQFEKYIVRLDQFRRELSYVTKTKRNFRNNRPTTAPKAAS